MKDILRYEFPKYLDFIDYFHYSITCKEIYNLVKVSLDKKRKEKIQEMESLFDRKMINMIGREKLLKSKYIKWNKKWEIEDYLTDVRDAKDLPSNICYSKDTYGRIFLFVKVRVEDLILDSVLNLNLNHTIITISQKYSDISIYFASDPQNYAIAGYNRGFFIDEDTYEYFKSFFKNNFFSHKEHPYTFIELPAYSKIFFETFY
jgi:hypothetical protein